MDGTPWTYGLMGAERRRHRPDSFAAVGSAAPGTPGTPEQYLIVQLDSTVERAAAVGVDIRSAGTERFDSNDLGTRYPLYDGGEGRTRVKVPLGLVSRPIGALTLRLRPSSLTAPSIVLHRVEVLQYKDGRIVATRVPTTG